MRKLLGKDARAYLRHEKIFEFKVRIVRALQLISSDLSTFVICCHIKLKKNSLVEWVFWKIIYQQ